MPAFLALIPSRVYEYGAIILVLLLAFGGYTIHERHVGAADKVAALKKSSDELQAKAAAHIVLVAKAYATASTANLEKLNDQLKAASDQHDSDAQRLREYDAYRRAHPAVASAQTGSGVGSAGTSSSSEDDGRFASLEQVALSLATAGREVTSALTACMVDRDALTGKP